MLRNVFLTFLFLAYSSCGYCVSEVPNTNAAEEGASKLLSTVDGTVLFWGWEGGHDVNYDASKLTEKEKADYTKIGLDEMAERYENVVSHEDAGYFSEILAKYYFLRKDTKKNLYWSFKAVEHGSSTCMRILADAYMHGNGVIQDLEEGGKWRYLGAAAGDESCKQWVSTNATALFDETTGPILKEAQKRAKNWMESHKDVFFSPK
ncbi:sel1 repeat family protein [Parachlamydia acanthamoebae]|jgi:hypothetical protein|uniref:sel1 repeat family protein n=1 Tax=Parachlamydia acanthamoebae TaxID=83552 RepID=UPI0001C175CE|nr:sel1 repeat family protein [Parachlamydia acanthamoebae]EFB40265.1 hypothetical protein pah_c212o006 [Parachlamydia acanthamoebae str. Hall's coccus]